MNYSQIPVNAPIAPVANFQRDGFMTINSQGFRPNYQSSLIPLTYKKKAYENVEHEVWLGKAKVGFEGASEQEVREGPVQFEKDTGDVFGLDKFLDEAKSGRKRGLDTEV